MLYSNKDYKLHHNNIFIDRWKKRKYGHRSMAETAFSCLKKTLGVCLCRQVSKYDKRKILKVSLY